MAIVAGLAGAPPDAQDSAKGLEGDVGPYQGAAIDFGDLR
jgi:hypothetical protein